MKRRMNAGRRRGRIGMAWMHQDASWLVGQGRELDKLLDEYLAKQKKDMDDVVNLALPALDKVNSGLGLAARIGLSMNPLFGVTIEPPRRMAGIDSGFPALDKELAGGIRKGELTVFGGRVGVPAFMAPRDNGHRLSRDERAKYDELCANNTYVPPERKETRYGAPEWPEGTELVDGRHPDAGKYGKLCYRTACQAPNAFYWNIGSRQHYCQECADIINREGMGGDRLLFLSEKEGAHA